MSEIITIEAEVQAPVSRAWEVYTEPEYVVQWNHASEDWQCPRAENDLRVGGKFNYRMEAKDGSMGFDFNGIYSEVRVHEYIAYNIEGGRKVEVTFIPHGDVTKVVVAFEAETENSIELQRGGWQAILDNFKGCVEG